MRTLTLAFTGITMATLAGAVLAEPKDAAVKAVTVEKVLNANPEPDGKAYRIDLQLRGGKRVSFEISPAEATKLADGLSKPAVAGGERQKVATLVYGMGVEVDGKGLAVVLTPRGRSGPLESLAIPLAGAEPLVSVLQAKIEEAKAKVTKPPNPPK